MFYLLLLLLFKNHFEFLFFKLFFAIRDRTHDATCDATHDPTLDLTPLPICNLIHDLIQSYPV